MSNNTILLSLILVGSGFLLGVFVSTVLYGFQGTTMVPTEPVDFYRPALHTSTTETGQTVEPLQTGLHHPNPDTMSGYYNDKMDREKLDRRNPYEPADWNDIGKQE